VSAAALVQFDPELVRDREVHFLSFPLGERIFSEIEAWTSSGGRYRAWDVAGIVVLEDAWVAIFTRPRLSPNVRGTKDITWMDLRGALAEAFLAGALSRHRKKALPEEALSIVRSEAAEYADKNHRAVGE
jgi:hypothetical protein